MKEITEKYIEFEKWWDKHGLATDYGKGKIIKHTSHFQDFIHWLVKGEPTP